VKTIVKICGLNDSDSVAAAIDAGADAVGFVFARSVREVSVEQALKISRQVPEGILRVAVMLHPTQEQWQHISAQFQPDVLQTDAADFDYLEVSDTVERWPVYREGQLQRDTDLPNRFVYEGSKSGQGQTVDWQLAANLAGGEKMILAGGLSPHNVAAAIRQVRPFGVDVSSGVETSPGRKDVAKIAAFVMAVRAAQEATR